MVTRRGLPSTGAIREFVKILRISLYTGNSPSIQGQFRVVQKHYELIILSKKSSHLLLHKCCDIFFVIHNM